MTRRSRATPSSPCCSIPPATAGRSAAGAARPTRPGGEARRATAAVARSGNGCGPRPSSVTAPAAGAPPAAGGQPVPMPAGPVRLAVAGPRGVRLDLRRPRPAGDRARPRHLLRRFAPSPGWPARTGRGRCSTPETASGAGSPKPMPPATRRCRVLLRGCLSTRRSDPTMPPAEPEWALSSPPSPPSRRPFGAGASPGGISNAGIPGAAPGPGARTHYAFDSSGAGGTVRVVVIDNSLGSLAASDPHQNPAEAQLPWLTAVLADARAKGIPTVVMGNRSLNVNFTPKLNVAADGTQVAQVLVAGGASAYLFDRPEENRVIQIPAGGADTIPSFGVGTSRVPIPDRRRGRPGNRRRPLRRRRRPGPRGGRGSAGPRDQPGAGRGTARSR